MNHYPDKSKTELRQLNKAVYAWLYRNDKEWLKFNSPEPIYKYKNTRVDWDKRDKEILAKVKVVVEEMLYSTEKPERITISLIGSKLGIRDVTWETFGQNATYQAVSWFGPGKQEGLPVKKDKVGSSGVEKTGRISKAVESAEKSGDKEGILQRYGEFYI